MAISAGRSSHQPCLARLVEARLDLVTPSTPQPAIQGRRRPTATITSFPLGDRSSRGHRPGYGKAPPTCQGVPAAPCAIVLRKGGAHRRVFPWMGVGIDPFYAGFPSNCTYNVELDTGLSKGDGLSGVRRVPNSADRAATMIEENRLQRFPFRRGTLLFVVAILALFLVVVIQQVQIRHQQVQIRQMRQNVDRIPNEIFRFVDAVSEFQVR